MKKYNKDNEWTGKYRRCGGSLVKSDVVLTAAECIHGYGPGDVSVVINRKDMDDKSKGEEIDAKELILHPKYDDNHDKNFDFGLIVLKKATTEHNKVFILNKDEDFPKTGEEATVMGWGCTNPPAKKDPDEDDLSDVALHVDLKVLSNDKCKKEWPDRIKNIISVHLARRRPGA
jgi:secreted trypsin-like serine protease